jgi:hypothetical protein
MGNNGRDLIGYLPGIDLAQGANRISLMLLEPDGAHC